MLRLDLFTLGGGCERVFSFSIFFSLVVCSLLSNNCNLCCCWFVSSFVCVSNCILFNNCSSSSIFSLIVAKREV